MSHSGRSDLPPFDSRFRVVSTTVTSPPSPGTSVRHVFQRDVRLDLVAETFARALECRKQYQPELGPARAWLLGIARNLIVDSVRRGQVEADSRFRLGMRPLVLDDRQLEASIGDSGFDLQAALAELPADQRDAVVRRIVLDESPTQRWPGTSRAQSR